VVAYALPSFLVGAGDGSWSANGDGDGFGEFGDGRVQSVADEVIAAPCRVLIRGGRSRRGRRRGLSTSVVARWPSMIRLPWSAQPQDR
jgi:hypothetical protein